MAARLRRRSSSSTHIQSGALHERPSPYVGRYLLLRIDDRAAGRELVRRLHPVVDASRDPNAARDAWATVAFTYNGLKRLGVPQVSLDSFAPEFRQGMAARAAELGDVGASAPPTGKRRSAPGRARRDQRHLAERRPARGGRRARTPRTRGAARRRGDLAPGLLPAADRTYVVRLQGRDRPARDRRQRDRRLEPARAADQGGRVPPRLPRRDGRAAADADAGGARPERHVHRLPEAAHEASPHTASTCARTRPTARRRRRCWARRWSGAGRAARRWSLAADEDDPELGADPGRNNAFLYGDDLRGFKCPAGAHARRANPRDSLDGDGNVNVRLHRMIRRGTSYGPMLPEGVLEDDGVDRGIVFVFVGAHLKRQFEFVKTQWLDDGVFIGAPEESGPARRTQRRARHVHDPAAPDPPAPAGTDAVRDHERRRVLLRTRPAALRWLGRTEHLTRREHRGDTSRTDRWDALDFSPPADGRRRPRRSRAARVRGRRPHRGDHAQRPHPTMRSRPRWARG